MVEALERLEFSTEEISAIHRILAACLFLGEIKLNESTYDERNQKPVSIASMTEMEHFCGLLGIKDVEGMIAEMVNTPAMKGVAGRRPELKHLVPR